MPAISSAVYSLSPILILAGCAGAAATSAGLVGCAGTAATSAGLAGLVGCAGAAGFTLPAGFWNRPFSSRGTFSFGTCAFTFSCSLLSNSRGDSSRPRASLAEIVGASILLAAACWSACSIDVIPGSTPGDVISGSINALYRFGVMCVQLTEQSPSLANSDLDRQDVFRFGCLQTAAEFLDSSHEKIVQQLLGAASGKLVSCPCLLVRRHLYQRRHLAQVAGQTDSGRGCVGAIGGKEGIPSSGSSGMAGAGPGWLPGTLGGCTPGAGGGGTIGVIPGMAIDT